MSAFFQQLCEATPLATWLMALALFRVGKGKASATRLHLMVMAACTISIAAPLLVGSLPKWRVFPALSETRPGSSTVENLEPVSAVVATHRQAPTDGSLWFRVMAVVWFAGALTFLAAVILRHLQLIRMLGESRSVAAGTSALADRLRVRRRIRRNIRIAVHDTALSAFTFGVFRPCIILPANHSTISREEIRIILDHEIAHIQRLDALTEWILQAFLAMWWFHPLAWFTYRHASVVKERACDDLVLLSGEDPRRYAACLGTAVLRAYRDPALLPAVSTFARKAHQLTRVHAILDPSIQRTMLNPVETLRTCGPVTLMAVVISSLGFKAAADLQPPLPTTSSSTSNADLPCLWTDAVEPLVSRIATGSRIPSADLHKTPSAPKEFNRPGNRDSYSSPRFVQKPKPARLPSHVSSRRLRGGGLEQITAASTIPASGTSIASNGTIGGYGSTGWSSTGSAGISQQAQSAPDENIQAYGYVAMEDAGIMLYSGIGANSPELSAPVESGVAASSPTDTTLPQPIEEPGQDTIAVVESSTGPLGAEALGIRGVSATIPNSGDGGHLTVSCEVPAETEALWTAEASRDAKSWTSSDEIIVQDISSGSDPGFIRITASLRESVASSSHNLIRLKGRW